MNTNRVTLTFLIPFCIALRGRFISNFFAIDATYVSPPVNNTRAHPLPVVTEEPARQMFSLSRISKGRWPSQGKKRTSLSTGMSSPVKDACETVREEAEISTQSLGKTSPPGFVCARERKHGWNEAGN